MGTPDGVHHGKGVPGVVSGPQRKPREEERLKAVGLWKGKEEILGSEAMVSSCLAWEQAPPGDQVPERRAAAVASRGQAGGRSPPPASALRLDALS